MSNNVRQPSLHVNLQGRGLIDPGPCCCSRQPAGQVSDDSKSLVKYIKIRMISVRKVFIFFIISEK